MWVRVCVNVCEYRSPLWTHLHLYRAGEFYDAVTYVRRVFVPWEIEIPGSVRLSAAHGSSVHGCTWSRVVARTISRRLVQSCAFWCMSM